MKDQSTQLPPKVAAHWPLYAKQPSAHNRDYRKKFPPYGKAVAARCLAGDSPFLTYILAYGHPNYPWQLPRDAWKHAKSINESPNASAALIMPEGEPPERYKWPVQDRICVVEHWPSRGVDGLVSALAACLKRYGAEHVIVKDAHFDCIRQVF